MTDRDRLLDSIDRLYDRDAHMPPVPPEAEAFLYVPSNPPPYRGLRIAIVVALAALAGVLIFSAARAQGLERVTGWYISACPHAPEERGCYEISETYESKSECAIMVQRIETKLVGARLMCRYRDDLVMVPVRGK